jgi:hypothetical protein
MITLGDIRKAGEGLPDNTPVFLEVTNNPEPFVDVEFTNVQPIQQTSSIHPMSVRILAEVDIDENTYEEGDEELTLEYPLQIHLSATISVGGKQHEIWGIVPHNTTDPDGVTISDLDLDKAQWFEGDPDGSETRLWGIHHRNANNIKITGETG